MPVSRELCRPPYDDLGEDQRLAPVLGTSGRVTLDDWHARRKVLLARWNEVLGRPWHDRPTAAAEVVDAFEQPHCAVTVFRQPTGPDTRQLVALLEPKDEPHTPRPGAVVPFYHPDPMAGIDLATKAPLSERPLTQFGRHLVQQGYVVVCVEAFPYNTVPDPGSDASFAWWHAAAAKVLADNPQWTGMGKLVRDTRLATDLLLDQPNVDADRVVIIGHSLGGKMAFYAGCLDERIKAIVASDFGIGYSFTNWQDPWYLGAKVTDLDVGHHHLLALCAPRAFFLIAGLYDKPESWQYLNAAREAYKLYGREEAIGMVDHATGHQPTEEAMRLAYTWLAEQFGLPETPYEL